MTIHTLHGGPALTISLLQMIQQSWEFARDLLECRHVKYIGPIIQMHVMEVGPSFGSFFKALQHHVTRSALAACISPASPFHGQWHAMPSQPHTCHVETNAVINEGRLQHLAQVLHCGGKSAIKAFFIFRCRLIYVYEVRRMSAELRGSD